MTYPENSDAARAATPAASERTHHQEGSSMAILVQGDAPQEPLIVNTLLAEADKLLPTLLASRLASASACFPGPDGGTVYVQSSGNRVNIAVTEKDPDTKQLVTREFTAVITEVTR